MGEFKGDSVQVSEASTNNVSVAVPSANNAPASIDYVAYAARLIAAEMEEKRAKNAAKRAQIDTYKKELTAALNAAITSLSLTRKQPIVGQVTLTPLHHKPEYSYTADGCFCARCILMRRGEEEEQKQYESANEN